MPEYPFALQWIIPEYRLTPLKDSINCLLSTSVSNIPGFEYYLSIFPNGFNEKTRGNAWIGLQITLGNVKNVEAEYTITIESAKSSFKRNFCYKKSTGSGIFIAQSADFFYNSKKRFIVNGICRIKIVGIFKFETQELFADLQKWESGELGDDLWKKEDSKDFTILVEDKEIKVHKFILESDVFEAMVNPETTESKESKVEINDFSFNVVETAVKMIYNCNFTPSLSIDEIMSLLQFFDKYQIQKLKDKVESLLIRQISAPTVCRLLNCSIFTNSMKLKENCIECFRASLAAKFRLNDYDILDKNLVVEIIRKNLYRFVKTESFNL